jgi:polar amino acid transport system substrate-binding protein
MKRFQYILAGLSFCCAVQTWAAEAHAIELVTEDDPPHNMLNKDGKLVGAATEKLEEAFRRAGVPEHATLMPWARAYQSALSTPDVCVFSAARTAEREPLFRWVGPVATLDWVLYARAGYPHKPAKLEDVRKETLGGYLQDVISVWLANNGYHVDTAPGDDYNPQKLLNGRFNFWASSRTRAGALLAKQGLTDRIVPVLTFGRTDLYLACNPGVPQPTIARLNEALREMGADGASAKIEAHYPN